MTDPAVTKETYPIVYFFEQEWPKLVSLFEQKILTWHSLVQIGLILLGYGIAFIATKTIKAKLQHKIQKQREAGEEAKFLRALTKHFLPFSWMIALWFYLPICDLLLIDRDGLRISASLLSAWVFVSIFTKIWAKSFLTKTLAFLIWILATIDILGLLEETRTFLAETIIPLGKNEVSLLVLLRFALLALFLVWGALFISSSAQKRIKKSQSLTPSAKVLIGKGIHFSLLALAVLFSLVATGIDLSSLAFFGGALGVGIGFGLQKIVANLISGIILLVDRSIKPGDILEIGGKQGIVNNLGARFTSILTRDGKEILIPNENIITQEVVNWSYSNEFIRSDIPIGVSYSSDIDLVTKILLDIASEHPRVLKYPEIYAPLCSLVAFADSSVNFVLRVWIRDPQNGVGNVTDQILRSVWKKFKEENIEIPFPQRDLHIKTQGLIQTLAK
jgi:small-conductance mechanosensitive channel